MREADSTEKSDPFSLVLDDLLAHNRSIRRKLPGGGWVFIDTQLPFLCIYRRPGDRLDPGMHRLVLRGTSYLVAPGGRGQGKKLSGLVRQIAGALSARFRGCLIVELWSSADAPAPRDPPPADFRIVAAKVKSHAATIETLERALREIRLGGRNAEVEILISSPVAPPGMRALLTAAEAKALDCVLIGLEVEPTFRRHGSGAPFGPELLAMERGVDRALKKTYFTFSCVQTSHRPDYYFPPGRRALVRAAWDVDRQLAALSDSFDLLLQVTPVNAEAAWQQFKRSRYEVTPQFQYRKLPDHPALLKRSLFNIPLERIEDATLSQLFREKQDELDRQITLLADIGTERFMQGSLQLYGGIEEGLLALAGEILQKLPPGSDGDATRGSLDAERFAERAQAEINAYRRAYADFWAQVQVRQDMYSGLLVSQGKLLVGAQSKIPAARVEALLSHEVGTHLVTYFNGLSQPIRQLHTGLPGYEELQEGLAVLSEYLVGGLSPARLRLLAARVLAGRLMVDGASFVDTFRTLVQGYDFPRKIAYTIAMRTYRGGGFTKDAVYLRGLAKMLDYLHEGGELEPLFVGKISSAHVPMIRELQLREVLHPVPLHPHFLQDDQARGRLDRLRCGLRLLDLIDDFS